LGGKVGFVLFVAAVGQIEQAFVAAAIKGSASTGGSLAAIGKDRAVLFWRRSRDRRIFFLSCRSNHRRLEGKNMALATMLVEGKRLFATMSRTVLESIRVTCLYRRCKDQVLYMYRERYNTVYGTNYYN
jgi:hypothetical protein